MARINIEDTLFSDRRFMKLLTKVGCEYKAMGIVVSAWILAQKNWLKNKAIPEKSWNKDLDILIEVELAERLENGDVYIKGSSKSFAWLERNSAGGKSKSPVKTKNLKQNLTKKTEPSPNLNRTTSEALTLTPSLNSLSSSISSSNSNSSSKEKGCMAFATLPHRLAQIWNEFCGKLPKVQLVNAKRKKLCDVRWKELDELQWIEVVKRLSASDFCNGKNDRGWRADFDFLLKPDTGSRTLEGRYDNRQGTQSGMTEDGRYLTPAMKRSHNNLAMFKKLNGDESEERDVEASLSDG